MPLYARFDLESQGVRSERSLDITSKPRIEPRRHLSRVMIARAEMAWVYNPELEKSRENSRCFLIPKLDALLVKIDLDLLHQKEIHHHPAALLPHRRDGNNFSCLYLLTSVIICPCPLSHYSTCLIVNISCPNDLTESILLLILFFQSRLRVYRGHQPFQPHS